MSFICYYLENKNGQYCDFSNDSFVFLLSNCIENMTFEQKVNLEGKIARPKLNITQKDGKYA
jgi:hypothetical protein